MTHDEAIQVLGRLVHDENLTRHHLATGTCMKALAQALKNVHKKELSLPFFKSDKQPIHEEEWEIVGLLHDADYERTSERPMEHGKIVIDEVRSLGFQLSPEVSEAIKFHNKENTNASESLMGWAIYVCDELTGLIIACAQVSTDKKLGSITSDFVMQKLNDNSFAKSLRRERVFLCEEKLGIPLSQAIAICLSAMQEIAGEIGL